MFARLTAASAFVATAHAFGANLNTAELCTPDVCGCSPPEPAAPLMCVDAGTQSPRDLSTGAEGYLSATAAVLNVAQTGMMTQTNTHFHLGAEHKSDSYSDTTDSEMFDADDHSRRLLSEDPVRPGYMCTTGDDITKEQLMPYDWQYCEGEMHVGKSYEVHYVYSSAGTGGLSDGLGTAAGIREGGNIANPMITVNAQIFHIVNDGTSDTYPDLVHGWMEPANAVMYAGSTTGTSYNNDVCSPYAITWHVDLDCHHISAAAFDNMCRVMSEEYGMASDISPHGSRSYVDEQFVVPASQVYPLA